MLYLTVSSGALTSFPLDCRIKNDNSQNNNGHLVWTNQNYTYFSSDWQKMYFSVCHRTSVLVYACHEMTKVERRSPKRHLFTGEKRNPELHVSRRSVREHSQPLSRSRPDQKHLERPSPGAATDERVRPDHRNLSVIKRTELLVHPTQRIHFKSIVLSEDTQTEEARWLHS